MENKEYLQDLKKLINGEMVAAMQYKIIADSIVGDKNLSYIQSHCDEHYQEELGHYTMLVNALMQREDNIELNLSSIVGEALPETEEMTSNNGLDAAEFFSRSEDNAINAYLEFHEKIKDIDPDLDDIITGIISDERDHKLDFDRVIGSDEELEVEDSEEDIEEESDESEDETEELDEPEKDEPEKKDKFNFDFSDDEDEIKESRKMRNRVREKSNLDIKDFKKKILDVFEENNIEINDYYFDYDDQYPEALYIETDNMNQYKLSNLSSSLYRLITENPGLGYDKESGNNGFYSKKYVFYIYDDLDESRKTRNRSLREEKEKWYYGIPGVRLISHGTQSDAEVEYKGKCVSEYHLINTMWGFYVKDCEDEGKPVDEDYFDNHYMKDNADDVKMVITELPSSRSDDLDESRKLSRGKRFRETKIGYDLLDGNFKPWSGAISRWEEILENDLLEELDAYLEELYPDGMTETELNDFLWFEGDGFLASYLDRDQGDDEDDYEDEDSSDEEFEDDPEEFEEFVNRKINRVRELSERPSNSFVERKLHNKEKYSDSINKFAERIR